MKISRYLIVLVPGLNWMSVLMLTQSELTWACREAEAEFVMADTAMSVRVEALKRDVPFTYFRYPHLCENGDFLFIVDDPEKFNDESDFLLHGVYLSRATDGALVSIAEINHPFSETIEDFPRHIRGLPSVGLQRN